MTRVFCPWVTCKHNPSNVCGDTGECTMSILLLGVKGDPDLDNLECTNYVCDDNKKIKDRG